MKTKEEYRSEVSRRKKDFSPEELFRRSQAIGRRIEALPHFRQARIIAAYWSLPDEVSTHALIEHWCREKQLLLPVMCAGNRLELKPYHENGTLREAAFRIREPEGEAHRGPVDLILVPGIAFDRNHHRLGRGKGYYDRLLKEVDSYKVGICFDFQLFDELPTDEFDVPMNEVIAG